MQQNVIIDLQTRKDNDDREFYFGKLQSPMKLTFERGAAFFIFIYEQSSSEEQEEVNGEIRIASAKPGARCFPIKRSFRTESNEVNRYHISLKEQFNISEPGMKKAYLAVVQDDSIQLDAFEGLAFFIFNSKPGYEELQISKLTVQDKTKTGKSGPWALHQDQIDRIAR